MVIRMMGGLSLSRDGKTVATSDSRMKKVWTLIAYLVLHRNDPISLEELTGILWNGSECNDPSNALKNLAYRSRRMMEPLHREGEGEFIIFANGVYLWNPDIPCRVDCEEMEECYRQASSPELSPQKRLALLEQGLDEYQGDFLPRLAFNQWAAEQCRYYQTIEEKSVLLSAELLQTVGREKSIIGLAQWAVRSQPLSGTFQAMLIRTHLAAGNYTRALEQYNTAADLFYRQKGTGVPEEVRAVYQQLLQKAHSSDFDLSIIKEELREDTLLGAFFCDYEAFKNIYHLQARTLLREGRFLYIALLSFYGKDGDSPSDRQICEAMTALKDTLVKRLRKGDVIAAYSPSQYVLMLPLKDAATGEGVLERLRTSFFEEHPEINLRMETDLSMVEPTV